MTSLEVEPAELDPNVDYIEALAERLLGADPDQRAQFLRRLNTPQRLLVKKALDAKTDPYGTAVYRKLGYEPICIPRVTLALELGYANPIEAEDAGVELPPMCGQCPAERFDKAREFDVLFGGAAGGSKTKSSLMFGVRCMARWPGFRALFLRETFDELDENVYPELRAINYAEAIGGRWNAGRKQLDIGLSSMRFRYMHDLEDIRRRRGGSYQGIFLDERNQLPSGTADGLRDRLRSANRRIPVIGLRSTANPGGKSHSELKAGYVKPDPREHPTVVDEHGDVLTTITRGSATYERRFIPAKSSDNPYLGPEYENTILAGIEDPVLRGAMKDGNWDVFVGQYFAEWSDARHIVPASAVTLDPAWPRYEGIDYGRAAPFCMLRAAIDGDGRAWVYSEIYKAGLDEAVQARMIREDEEARGDRGARRSADPSMWGKQGAAATFAQTYAAEGVPLVKAKNDRITGWGRVHAYLADMTVELPAGVVGASPARVGSPCGYHAGLGWPTCPRLHVLEGACPNLVRTLPDMIHDPHNVEDAWSEGEDHAPDALRYLLMHSRLTMVMAKVSAPGAQRVR